MHIFTTFAAVMKRLLTVFALWALLILPSFAVLKEKDLANTLTILRTELTQYHQDLEMQAGFMKEQRERITKNLISVLNRSNQNALMLYSQKSDYIFDLTYACHEATEQYKEFTKNVMPFNSFIERTDGEIARYDSLITSLSTMPITTLSEKSQIDRNVCLTLAVNIRRTLNANRAQINDYIQYYKSTEERLKYLNDYANKRYADIQTSIFKNGGDDYFTILSQLGHTVQQTSMTVAEKYKPVRQVKSQWDSRMILELFLIILLYGTISAFINFYLVRKFANKLIQKANRLFVKEEESEKKGFFNFDKVTNWFFEKIYQLFDSSKYDGKRAFFEDKIETLEKKQTCVIMAMTVVTFAIILGIVIVSIRQNFLIMASKLLVEYAWLLGVILFTLLLRVNRDQIMRTFRIYTPLMVIGLIIIVFRIVLIPNDLVNLIFPPILLACTIWQISALTRHSDKIAMEDKVFSWITTAVFVASLVCAWIGYTLLSVEMLIWWIMQLTCILTITCLWQWLKIYSEKHKFKEKPISQTWLFNFVHSVVLPALGVLSIIVSVYWAANVFNLSDTTWQIFTHNFINSKNIRVSIFALVQVVILYFLFAYINRTAKAVSANIIDKSQKKSVAASRNVMSRNIIQVIVWGLWFILALSLLHVNNTWLVVVSGGLSTGIGFAMKDILENIYYGISLMAGRLKVGDWIICDGTRGQVSSISYTSTMVNTTDGSVIAFQNSQLFTKNYKNMTKNHGYELDVLEVGVAYGTDIDHCRAVLKEAIEQLNFLQPGKEVKITLNSFSDSAITLKILVWVPVKTQYTNDSQVLECVYKTLMENNIEIPFPQTDVHIIHSGDAQKVITKAETEE